MTELAWWCETVTCPVCDGAGFVVGFVFFGCYCHGTGVILRANYSDALAIRDQRDRDYGAKL